MSFRERAVAWIGFTGTLFITIGAFWLSFAALHRLAIKADIEADLAWMWPLIVDGMIVTSTIAVVAMKQERDRWYPWLLLICSAAVSVSANALQAFMPEAERVPELMAAAVASVPPVVLLAVTHLAVILARRTQHTAVDPSTKSAPEWTNAQEFLLSFLAGNDGTAMAGDVIAAAQEAGFSPDQVKKARLRCTDPPVTSAKDAVRGGWVWSIQRAQGATRHLD